MDKLLTDEQLAKVCGWEDLQGIDDYEREIAKAQLAHCEPLIRAEVAGEILGEIDKISYPQEVVLIGEAMHGVKYPKHQIVIDKEQLQQLKANYGVK